MKTEEKAKKVQNIATALAAIFGAVGAFFGIFQAQMSANLKNQVTSLQNASQQTIVNVISTLGDDAQAADLAQSGDTVAITEQLINVYNSTKDQNAALTSETQTLRSENAALQEQVENLKSVLLNTYSMDEIDTVVAQGYLDEVETKRLDNLELLDSERCEQVASVRDLYGTTHSVSYKFDPWQEASKPSVLWRGCIDAGPVARGCDRSTAGNRALGTSCGSDIVRLLPCKRNLAIRGKSAGISFGVGSRTITNRKYIYSRRNGYDHRLADGTLYAGCQNVYGRFQLLRHGHCAQRKWLGNL